MLSILLLSLLTLAGANIPQNSLTLYPSYPQQRQCALVCFGQDLVETGPFNLARGIGCNEQDQPTSCLCRPDLQASAELYLQSCLFSTCSNDADVASATSIYDGYCTSAGFLKAEVSTIASSPARASSNSPQTSKSPSSPASSTSKSTTAINQPTSTPASSGNSKDNSLSAGEIVGIVVGVLGFIATTIGSWFSYKAVKRRKEDKRDSTAQSGQHFSEHAIGTGPVYRPGYHGGGHQTHEMGVVR